MEKRIAKNILLGSLLIAYAGLVSADINGGIIDKVGGGAINSGDAVDIVGDITGGSINDALTISAFGDITTTQGNVNVGGIIINGLTNDISGLNSLVTTGGITTNSSITAQTVNATTVNATHVNVGQIAIDGTTGRISGIAAGIAPNDAVNVQQLNNALGDTTRTLSRGIASIAAMSNIPQVDAGKRFSVGVGVGSYDGQTGYALGASMRLSQNGIGKVSVGTSGSSKTVVGAGAAFSW